MQITLNYPSLPQLLDDLKLLARYGLEDRSDILGIATHGTTDNPRKVLAAAGRVAMTMHCRCCGLHHLDPTDKDALGVELCRPCLDEAELENEHSDHGHPEPVDGCPSCAPVEVTP
jgi:hypothetical protein